MHISQNVVNALIYIPVVFTVSIRVYSNNIIKCIYILAILLSTIRKGSFHLKFEMANGQNRFECITFKARFQIHFKLIKTMTKTKNKVQNLTQSNQKMCSINESAFVTF